MSPAFCVCVNHLIIAIICLIVHNVRIMVAFVRFEEVFINTVEKEWSFYSVPAFGIFLLIPRQSMFPSNRRAFVRTLQISAFMYKSSDLVRDFTRADTFIYILLK